jgi:hypothetical protein
MPRGKKSEDTGREKPLNELSALEGKSTKVIRDALNAAIERQKEAGELRRSRGVAGRGIDHKFDKIREQYESRLDDLDKSMRAKVEILVALENGHTPKDAASLSMVPFQQMMQWANDDEDFRYACEAAEARAMDIFMGVIRDAAQSNWFAAAWMLERRYPERFSRYRQVKVEEEQTAKNLPVVERVIRWSIQKGLPAPAVDAIDTQVVNNDGDPMPPDKDTPSKGVIQ